MPENRLPTDPELAGSQIEGARPKAAKHFLTLTLSYDGTNYAGWQIQPNEPTIQGTLEQAWKSITGEQPNLVASGRTDAGVHARGQVVSVATETRLTCNRLLEGLNALLPNDIVVIGLQEAPADFHATYDAVRKTYVYQIYNARIPPLFDRAYRWHVRQPLDCAAMETAASHILGRRDFASFQTTGSERNSTVRTVLSLTLKQHGPQNELLDIAVTGDGFLYNMVRAIVGTLVEVGRGARTPDWVAGVVAARDRSAAGPTAPAHGLVLEEVVYPADRLRSE